MSITSKTKKVPDITVHFWAIKILSTAMGEAISDYLVGAINPVLAVGIGAVGLIIALIIQFKVPSYIAWKYWFTISMVAIFGTMAADVLHIGLGVPYVISTLLFAVILTLVFITWYVKEKTLSIHSITTVRREVFYWLTVMATFALGTATGDFTASTLHLGYLSSAILFVILILVPFIAYFKFGAKEVLAFWVAYVLTRPLGASFADWFGKPSSIGGVGLGDGLVGLVLIAAIVILVAYTSNRHSDIRSS